MENKKEMLEVKLEAEKKKWNDTVKDLVAMIRHVDNVSEAQVLMLSYRHQLVDKLVEMKNIVKSQQAQSWETRRTRYIHYKTNYNIKLNQSEINEFIDADVKDTILTISLLETQLIYYQMTIDTLDKMGFAISNKVSLAIKF